MPTPTLFFEPITQALYYDAGLIEFACNDFRDYAQGEAVELHGKVYVVSHGGRYAAKPARFDPAFLARLGLSNHEISAKKDAA